MSKLKNRFLLTAAASAVLLAVPAIAGHTWGNASGTYHWDGTSLPVQLSVIDSVDSTWQGEMDESIIKWNDSTALNLTVNTVDDGASARSSCAVTNGEIRVCNSAYGTSTGWLGLASLNIDSNNHILWGTAKVNDSYTMNQAEKNKVMCQEIGHLFGLGHTSEDGSSQLTCMDYANDPTNSQWPNAHDYTVLEEIYAHIGGGTPPPTGGSELTNGTPVTGVSASSGQQVKYYVDVPAGASNLSIAISGGTGDADLYTKFGSEPTKATGGYDCRPYKTGNTENCDVASPNEGRYYVMLDAYAAFSGVTLTATYTDGGTPPPSGCVSGNGVLCNGVAQSNISGARTSQTNFYMDVPAGASNLSFDMSGGTGDADMHVNFGSAATTSTWDCRPYKSGNNETCSFAAPSTGRYHVMIRGYSAYDGANLTASYTGGSALTSGDSAITPMIVKHPVHGVRIKSNNKTEMWLKRNADSTVTLTHVYLAREHNKPKKNSK